MYDLGKQQVCFLRQTNSTELALSANQLKAAALTCRQLSDRIHTFLWNAKTSDNSFVRIPALFVDDDIETAEIFRKFNHVEFADATYDHCRHLWSRDAKRDSFLVEVQFRGQFHSRMP